MNEHFKLIFPKIPLIPPTPPPNNNPTPTPTPAQSLHLPKSPRFGKHLRNTGLHKPVYTDMGSHRMACTHCWTPPPTRTHTTCRSPSLTQHSSAAHPQAMYGSTSLSMFSEALFSLTNTPLLICLRRRRSRIFLVRGWTPLILKGQGRRGEVEKEWGKK